MLNQIRIDRRVLFGFMILMWVLNAVVVLVSWKQIMAGKNDFPPLYASAQMVREGQASRLYDLEAENSYVHRVSPVIRPPNNHLPYENLVFIPFTYLQFGAAHTLWTVLSLGMLAVTAFLMCSLQPGKLTFWLTFVSILAFFPVWYCLGQGQDSVLLVLLFAGSFWLWRRGQDDLAGFVLAMGLFRPQLVLPFVLIAFLAGKWRFVRGFVPGAVLVVLVSTWIVGLGGMADYGRILISQGTQSSGSALLEQWCVRPGLMPTLRGLLWTLPSWFPGNIRTVLLLCGTFGALLWAAKRMRSAKNEAAFDLAFAMAVAVITVFSFHSFLHDFSLMIVPLLIAATAVVTSVRVTEKTAYITVTVGFLFFSTPLYLALLFTDKVGLFVLPTAVLLWLMSSWEKVGMPVLVAAENHSAEPSSLPAV